MKEGERRGQSLNRMTRTGFRGSLKSITDRRCLGSGWFWASGLPLRPSPRHLLSLLSKPYPSERHKGTFHKTSGN